MPPNADTPVSEQGAEAGQEVRIARPRRAVRVAIVLAAVVAGWLLWDGLVQALAESNKTRCITNERRLSSALLLYCQDHDGRMPPPDYPTESGEYRHWFGLLQSYLPSDERLVCPQLDIAGAQERTHGYPFPTSYALNGRFFGTFGAGAFPLENLELPAQTAMLAEAGPFADASGKPDVRYIMSVYHDAVTRPEAYPSPHSGRMNVAAADGHVVTVKPANAGPGGHDPLYGRLGGSIYNWNGGHPNGDTGGPPRE